VLVAFHDDMLDRVLEAYGDVSDYSWEELRQFRFREPGPFGDQCRIPTLVEVFDLHRKYSGLMHLDIKRPGLDAAVGALLTRMDMWDHVAYCNVENGGVILSDVRLVLRRYKAPGLYADRSEVFPDAIALALRQPGDGLIVDDPRGVAVALGRKLGKPSKDSVAPKGPIGRKDGERLPSEAELIAILRNADDWDHVGESEVDKAAYRDASSPEQGGGAIAGRRGIVEEAFAVLKERVRNVACIRIGTFTVSTRMALRSLILLRAPNAVETARFALYRDDPALEAVADPRWHNPRAWVDFRVKMVIFPALQKCPSSAAEKLCRDYLALSDEQAHRLSPALFAEAAKTLLTLSPQTETALELMKHRVRAVRGEAILVCLKHSEEPWARAALERGAPHALSYVVGE
jgi:hypothetical protein